MTTDAVTLNIHRLSTHQNERLIRSNTKQHRAPANAMPSRKERPKHLNKYAKHINNHPL